MECWNLEALPSSTEKERPRAPGPAAPRVPRRDGQIPRVLFSTPECRAVVVELEGDEAMGEHHVRERAIVQVVRGRVAIDASGESTECEAGTLVVFEPGERHSVRALEPSRLLLMLAPWPAPSHYGTDGAGHAQELPPNASVAPQSGAA